MDRTGQKMNEAMEDLNNTTNHLDQTDLYRPFQSITECTFFSSTLDPSPG